jgi:hypothetical protein
MAHPAADPTIEECTTAVAKAVGARRGRHRADPGCAWMSNNAIAERVTGITIPPRPGRDGWWLVGRVLDDIEDVEFSVWYLATPRRIGLTRRERPAVIAPTPPETPFYYDGLRRKWIDAKTGEIVAEPAERRHESGRPATT